MRAMKVRCPHCSRAITVDAEKLPAKKVAFSCPGCKRQVTVDPRSAAASGRRGATGLPGPSRTEGVAGTAIPRAEHEHAERSDGMAWRRSPARVAAVDRYPSQAPTSRATAMPA